MVRSDPSSAPIRLDETPVARPACCPLAEMLSLDKMLRGEFGFEAGSFFIARTEARVPVFNPLSSDCGVFPSDPPSFFAGPSALVDDDVLGEESWTGIPSPGFAPL